MSIEWNFAHEFSATGSCLRIYQSVKTVTKSRFIETWHSFSVEPQLTTFSLQMSQWLSVGTSWCKRATTRCATISTRVNPVYTTQTLWWSACNALLYLGSPGSKHAMSLQSELFTYPSLVCVLNYVQTGSVLLAWPGALVLCEVAVFSWCGTKE